MSGRVYIALIAVDTVGAPLLWIARPAHQELCPVKKLALN